MSTTLNIPFDAYQTITLLGLFGSAVFGYAELKLGFNGYKKSNSKDVATLTAEVERLKSERTALALLAKAIETLSEDVRGLNAELRTDRDERSRMGLSLARITERLRMEP